MKRRRYKWKPGEHLSLQQSATKYTGFRQRRRRYTVCFVIDGDGLPVWSGGGVKPTSETIERVTRYVKTGTLDR